MKVENDSHMKIAIQGVQGSFHHLVANAYFGEHVNLIECMSFGEIPDLITQNVVDGAVMAIENSIGGAILPNYNLIDSNNLSINGEIYMPMVLHLMALPGQNLEQIKEVWSHPVAIQHCQKFFRDHPSIKIIEAEDTAVVARNISRENLKGIAAIASKKAAEIYGLEILQEGIQSGLHDTTRYVVLNKQRHHHADDYLNDKASLKIISEHRPGSLLEILSVFAGHNINLSKIQSMPIAKEPWNYAFFIDLTFEDYHEYCKSLLTLEQEVKELKILGEYIQRNPMVNLTTQKIAV